MLEHICNFVQYSEYSTLLELQNIIYDFKIFSTLSMTTTTVTVSLAALLGP